MSSIRKVESALAAYLRSRKIVLGGDGLGGLHFVVVRCAPRTLPGVNAGGVDTVCSLCAQTGESCGFEHERVDLYDLAKVLVEA